MKYSIAILIIICLSVAIYFARKKIIQTNKEQQEMLQNNKRNLNLFIISKKKDKMTTKNFPSSYINQLPKWYKWRKFHIVVAKVESRIVSFICEAPVYNKIKLNKRGTASISGLYIMDIKYKK